MGQNGAIAAVSRRDFLKFGGATVLCACVGAVGLGACSSWREAYEVPLAPPGSYRREGKRVILSLRAAKAVLMPGTAVRLTWDEEEGLQEGILILRTGENAHHAFADRCTHRGKPLYYISAEAMLRCYSGKSKFDLAGNVLRGPAELRLSVYRVRRVGEELVIEG